MFDFLKFIAFCAIAWVLFLSVPIAAMLVGTVLALWILYGLFKIKDEEIDDVNPFGQIKRPSNHANQSSSSDKDIS